MYEALYCDFALLLEVKSCRALQVLNIYLHQHFVNFDSSILMEKLNLQVNCYYVFHSLISGHGVKPFLLNFIIIIGEDQLQCLAYFISNL